MTGSELREELIELECLLLRQYLHVLNSVIIYSVPYSGAVYAQTFYIVYYQRQYDLQSQQIDLYCYSKASASFKLRSVL